MDGHIFSGHAFKVGDPVLVRNNDHNPWELSFFGHMDCVFKCVNGIGWSQCIPLKGNELLVGTFNKPEKPQEEKPKEKSYTERQREWVEKTGCKEGSIVLIKTEAKDFQDGWSECWTESMDVYVGCYGRVQQINSYNGVVVETVQDMSPFIYPYFCLEVVKQ